MSQRNCLKCLSTLSVRVPKYLKCSSTLQVPSKCSLSVQVPECSPSLLNAWVSLSVFKYPLRARTSEHIWLEQNTCSKKIFYMYEKNGWEDFEKPNFEAVALLTSLFIFHLISFSPHSIDHVSFYLLQSIVYLIHFIYHSRSHSHLPYLVALILHRHSTFNQSRFWKLMACECLR